MSGDEGATSRPGTDDGAMTELNVSSPSNTSRMVGLTFRDTYANPWEAFACASMSTNRTRSPDWARLAARLTAVVVLPTPPF